MIRNVEMRDIIHVLISTDGLNELNLWFSASALKNYDSPSDLVFLCLKKKDPSSRLGRAKLGLTWLL